MNKSKILFVLLPVAFFIPVFVMAPVEILLDKKLASFLSFLYGLHFIYGFVFKTTIYMTGYFVPADGSRILRFLLMLSGCWIISFAVYLLI